MLWQVLNRARLVATRLGLVLFVIIAGNASAETSDDERPKIGLVLSGGGAKGCAHLGVLKVLEELQIPVDFIAGTSMGAIVGGLYASGYRSEELTEIVLALDWEDLLEDEAARRDRAYRRKLEDQKYILDFEFGVNRNGFVFPSGLRQGQKLLFELRRLSLPVADIEDFSRLPIPFAAVATELKRGEMKVLQRGDLAMSLRASMAIPGVFAPVEIDDDLLVDGGLIRNVPVDVVREMGANIVIAVDLGEPLLEVEQLRTLFDISSQAMGVLSRSNDEQQLANADIVLRPKVSGMGNLDFSQVAAIVETGEDAAQTHQSILAALALSDEAWQHYKAKKKLRQRKMTITELHIEGLQRIDERIIQRQLHLERGQELDLVQLEHDLKRIFGLGDFEQVDTVFRPEPDGIGVEIRVKEKPWGPNYLHTGLYIAIDDSEHTDINLIGNLTSRPLNRLAAEWRSDLMVGSQQRLRSEWMQPLDYSGRFFIAPSLDFNREVNDALLEHGGKATFKNRTSVAAFDFGITMGVSGETRFRIFRGRAKTTLQTPDHEQDSSEHLNVAGFAGQILIDHLDSAYFARHGTLANISYTVSSPGLGATHEYERFSLTHVAVNSWGRHTLGSWIEAGTTRGDEVPTYVWFPLGGLFSFSGYDRGELFGPHFAVYRPFYLFELTSLPSMVGKNLYFGAWIEAGNAWFDTNEIKLDNLRYAVTVGLGAETVIGPVYLSVGFAEEGRRRIYLAIGPSFAGDRPGF